MNNYDALSETFECVSCPGRIPIHKYHWSGSTTCLGCIIIHEYAIRDLLRQVKWVGEPGFIYRSDHDQSERSDDAHEE